MIGDLRTCRERHRDLVRALEARYVKTTIVVAPPPPRPVKRVNGVEYEIVFDGT